MKCQYWRPLLQNCHTCFIPRASPDRFSHLFILLLPCRAAQLPQASRCRDAPSSSTHWWTQSQPRLPVPQGTTPGAGLATITTPAMRRRPKRCLCCTCQAREQMTRIHAVQGSCKFDKAISDKYCTSPLGRRP